MRGRWRGGSHEAGEDDGRRRARGCLIADILVASCADAMRTGPSVYEGGIEAELEWEMVAEERFVQLHRAHS